MNNPKIERPTHPLPKLPVPFRTLRKRLRMFICLGTTAALAGATVGRSATPPAAVAEVMNQAIADRDKLPAASGSLWRYEGPTNWVIGSHYYGLAPYGGRVNQIAIHPTNHQKLSVHG